MLPSSAATISSYSLTPIQSNYSPAFSHSTNQPEYLPQSLADQSLDPNSPEIFKQNMQLVQQHVDRVNGLARSALNGMCVGDRRQSIQNTHGLCFIPAKMHIALGIRPRRLKVSLPVVLVSFTGCSLRSSGHHGAKAASTIIVRSNATNGRRGASSPAHAFTFNSV